MEKEKREARYRKCLVHKEATIYEAVDKMNESGLQLAIIVDDREIINDGDIRRAVLRKVDFFHPITEIANTNPRIANLRQSDAELRMMMRDYNIHQIPVVDDNGVVCEIKTFQELICATPKDSDGRRRGKTIASDDRELSQAFVESGRETNFGNHHR